MTVVSELVQGNLGTSRLSTRFAEVITGLLSRYIFLPWTPILPQTARSTEVVETSHRDWWPWLSPRDRYSLEVFNPCYARGPLRPCSTVAISPRSGPHVSVHLLSAIIVLVAKCTVIPTLGLPNQRLVQVIPATTAPYT